MITYLKLIENFKSDVRHAIKEYTAPFTSKNPLSEQRCIDVHALEEHLSRNTDIITLIDALKAIMRNLQTGFSISEWFGIRYSGGSRLRDNVMAVINNSAYSMESFLHACINDLTLAAEPGTLPIATEAELRETIVTLESDKAALAQQLDDLQQQLTVLEDANHKIAAELQRVRITMNKVQQSRPASPVTTDMTDTPASHSPSNSMLRDFRRLSARTQQT